MTIADITLPTWVVVGQWALLFALGTLVILMYRQLAFLLELANLGTEREGLKIGEKAAEFTYRQANNALSGREGHLKLTEGWLLLVFADPGCSSCQKALTILEHLAPKLEQTMRVVLVAPATPELIEAVDAFKNTSIDIYRVDQEVPFKLYRTYSTPFAYLINPQGVIQATGVPSDESALRKITVKAERSAINALIPTVSLRRDSSPMN